MTISVYTGKTDKAQRNRAIMLAMRNALPRSFYVCEEVDIPNRIELAAEFNCHDLVIVSTKAVEELIARRNSRYRFQLDPFQITYPPDTKFEYTDCIPSPCPPMTETSNPGGSA